MKFGTSSRRSTIIGIAALSIVLAISGLAQADTVTQLTSAADLSASDTVLTFPTVTSSTVLSSPVSFTAGTNTLTFSDTGGEFEEDTVGATYVETAFANATNIFYAAGYAGANGPITLTFGSPVSEVGFNAEEFANGPYTISLTAFDGATNLGTFTATGFDPAQGEPGGVLSFEGLRDSGGGITSLVISDANGNNIAVGPIAFGATATSTTVPEPGSLFQLGTALIGLGLIAGWKHYRRIV